MKQPDFSEIGHTGGKATFTLRADEVGRVSYSIGYTHARPTPMTLVAVYALPQGLVCGNVKLGGIGQSFNPPPSPDCVVVFMASDSEGRYGHQCPECQKHFRTESIPAHFPLTCPYCGSRGPSFNFLTPAQHAYVRHYVATLNQAFGDIQPATEAKVVIDMDSIAVFGSGGDFSGLRGRRPRLGFA